MERPSAIEFPCQFPIKVIGKADPNFEATIVSIFNRHFPNLSEGAFQSTTSKQGNYTSITITVTAQNQTQLDNVYMELSHCPEVIMAL